jgi:hypothetical protein
MLDRSQGGVGLLRTIEGHLRLLVLLAALLMWGRVGLAADMPAAGTKNFTPPSGTPSYFTDENGQVKGGAAAGPADTEEREEAAPATAATPPPATASQEESSRPAATAERVGGKSSHRYARSARHGGRYARYAPGRSSSSRHTVSLRRHEAHGRATAHATRSSEHGHAVAHAARSHTGSGTGKTVHAKPRSKRQHAERLLSPLLDSA